jgi:hypothetical protein
MSLARRQVMALDVAASSQQWAEALSVIDRGRRRLPRREMNWILDDVAIAIDAENEARATSVDRLTRGSLRRPRR